MKQELCDDITRFLYAERPPVPSEILFIPGGPWAELPELAAELYRKGYAEKILCSGLYAFREDAFDKVLSGKEKYGEDFRSEAQFYQAVLKANGVPDEAVILEEKARYTRQNAIFSAERCRELGLEPRSAILVCHGFHARRALVF